MSKKDTHTLGEPLVSIAARFPASLAAQIDGHLAAMRRTVPGVTIGRSDALRSLVMHALDALYGPTVNSVTDTVTDTHVQVQDVTAAALETPLVTDTVTDTPTHAEAVTEPPAPQSPATNARRRKRLPVTY